MLISAAGLKRELLTKNGLNVSATIKIFSETFLAVTTVCNVTDIQ